MQDLEAMKISPSLDQRVRGHRDTHVEPVCQNPKCKNKSRAVKVCHHSDCREANGNRPFLLCGECDVEIHGKRSGSGHLCFAIPKKGGHLLQNMRMVEKRTAENDRDIGKQFCDNGDKISNCTQYGFVGQKEKCTDRHLGRNCISGHHQQQNSADECEKTTRSLCNGVDNHLNESGDDDCDGVTQHWSDVISLRDHGLVNGECKDDDELCCQSADVDEKSAKDSCDINDSSLHRKIYRLNGISEPLSSSHASDLFENLVSNQELFNHGRNDLENQNKIKNVEPFDHFDEDHRMNEQPKVDQNCDVDAVIKLVDSDQCSDQSCVEGPCLTNGSTTNGQYFEDASQDDDDDDGEFSESDSSIFNHRLRRKKAMKIKKTKTAEFVRSYSSLSKIEIQRWKSFGKQDMEMKCQVGELHQNADCVPQDILASGDSTRTLDPEDQVALGSTTPSTLSRAGHDSTHGKSESPTDRKDSGSEKDSSGTALNSQSRSKDLCENPRNYQRNLQMQDDIRKRHIGTRILGTSKSNSEFFRKFSLTSEYFTLRFGSDELMIVAPKGLTLGRAISNLITEKWGLTLDRCDVFLNSSNSPLPLSSDCYLLANNTLRVKVKPNKQWKSRGNPAAVTFDSHPTSTALSPTEKNKQNGNIKTSKKLGSPDECSSVDAFTNFSSLSQNELQKLRNAKAANKFQSLFQFSKAPDKHEHLVELLYGFSNNGLPKMPDLLTLGRPCFDPSIFFLERHWKDIVANHEELTKSQRDQQEAIWELLTTEVEYIRKLRVVNDLFMCCLFNLQNEQVLNEIEADKLFSNIDDVYYATCHFWKVHLSQVLQGARETKELLNPCLLKSGFIVFHRIFEPYTKYCMEQDMCQDYIRTKTKENELFRNYVQWGQSQEQCRLLRLQDILCGPWQRLMRYRLLLKEILKYTEQIENPTPGDQVHDLQNMIEQVEKFVVQVNIALRVREESRQMSKLMNRIESYEVIESPSDECIKLLDKFCKLDLITPVPGCGPREMRMLVLEGNLKLKDAFSKMDVYCFLFTDLFLVTKPVSKKGSDKVRIIKPPMRLDKIVIQSLRDASSFVILYLNEYHVAQALYTFNGDSRLWTESLKKSQTEYKDKRFQYFIRPENNLFTDGDENVDEDNVYPAFLESPSVADLNRTGESVAPCRSQRSLDVPLPNASSELSVVSAADRSKYQHDSSRFNFSALGWPRKGKGAFGSSASLANSRLNSSCDQLALNGKENGTSRVPQKLRHSPSFSSTNSKTSNVNGASKQSTRDQHHSDEDRLVDGNRRHCSESISGRSNLDLRLQKRLSWDCDTNSQPKEPNHVHHSKSPTDSQKSGPVSEVPASIDCREHSRNGCVTFDGQDFGQLMSTRSSATSFNDLARLNHTQQSASLPVFPKLSPTSFAAFEGISEEEVPNQRPSKAFLLDDCTLESTDV